MTNPTQEAVKLFEEIMERCLNDYWSEKLNPLEKSRYIAEVNSAAYQSGVEAGREEGFDRGRRDILDAILMMGRKDEGLFILKNKFIEELKRQLIQKGKAK